MPATQITDEELKSLTQAILRRYGIDFTCYEPSSLKRRVDRCISVLKLETVHNLWVKLLKDQMFVHRFMDEISVGLTAMFRDPVLWKALKKDILNSLATKNRINIWHAGCSSGEEVYSMGIVLQESNLLSQSKAIATDISDAAIAGAQQGKYHHLKLAEYEKNYREYNPLGTFEKYYQKDGTDGAMNSELIKHVDFRHHNLISEPPPGQFDIIFCRNVMIYFDNQAKINLLQRFHQHLNDGGYLIIGFYDALVPLIDKSKYHIIDLDAKIFQKI
ncbi:CheR family methyltransferase [Tunicatimonas pelagia]|uniref:CheR family methyltransferase n=1 Tax=Tunicatimonas pelagia TaxID=931531 RepID=UPI002666A899|nr:protein-glutamate O-methyltransferase CheR [Tunicatimonas pelagia]WKN41386.1 protein-glutamate O-methyltransferase CheR [Tunicatimonas pelagia]